MLNTSFFSNRNIIIGLVSVILILTILIFTIGPGNGILKNLFPSPTPIPTPTVMTMPSPTPIDGDSIIYTGIRFTPQTMELTLGQVVNIANLGDNSIDIATNDTSTEGRKLNLGEIEAGGTSVFIEFREAGVYEYFDRVNPENKGRIIIK